MNLSLLSKLLSRAKPGEWVAVGRDQRKILAAGRDVGAVLESAKEQGEPDPFVIRIPHAPVFGSAPETDPVPYYEIAKAIDSGGVVPFLGAGASLIGRDPDQPFENTSRFFPTAGELKELLGREAEYPPYELEESDLAKVSSYLFWRFGRKALNKSLRSVLGPLGSEPRCKPGPLHHFIAGEKQIDLVITTNYDTLIEDAFVEAAREFDVLTYPVELPAHGNTVLLYPWGEAKPRQLDPQNMTSVGTGDDYDFTRTLIFKVHGTLAASPSSDEFVITEEDYLESLSRTITPTVLPAPIADRLRRQRLLFLGYGLRDWNLRLLLLKLIGRDVGWAIQRNVSQVESLLWRRRNVDVHDEDLSTFARELQNKLDQLRREPS